MLLDIARVVIGGALAASAVVAVGSWAITTRRLHPFSWPARAIRRVSDPVLVPIERAVLRRGGNPQHAPWWLLGGVIVLGILALTLLQVGVNTFHAVRRAWEGGPRSVLRLAVWATGNVLMLALIVRVVGSWLGAGRYSRLTAWSWRLTDWLVEPIRRWLPAFGMFDFSPLAAWFVLWLAQGVLLALL